MVSKVKGGEIRRKAQGDGVEVFWHCLKDFVYIKEKKTMLCIIKKSTHLLSIETFLDVRYAVNNVQS